LLSGKFLTNLNISYSLLATVLFASCLGLLNPHPDPVPVPYTILHHNVERQESGCPPGTELTLSYCLTSLNVGYKCWNPRDFYYSYETAPCPPDTVCIGIGPYDPIPTSGLTTATCVSNSKPKRVITWRTKLKNALKMQCHNFQFTSAELGMTLDDDNPTILGTLNVQVVHDTITYPPMPEEAILSYQGASYPIQSIEPKDMEMEYGSFVFTNVFDATQPLQFCVYASLQISFGWAFIPYPS
jgi:hypothetical protein